MMLLLPGNAKNLIPALDPSADDQYGWLLTPKRTMTKTGLNGWKYAFDNECFSREFSAVRYVSAIERAVSVHGAVDCLFATAPDVVGNAADTLDLADEWLPRLRALGVPAALVAQDGLEDFGFPMSEDFTDWCYGQAIDPDDDCAYWDAIQRYERECCAFDALFIGGSTAWKLSRAAADLIEHARRLGKWTHVGRVNSVTRASRLLVQPDSVDGTAWAKHPAHYAKTWGRWVNGGKLQQLSIV